MKTSKGKITEKAADTYTIISLLKSPSWATTSDLATLNFVYCNNIVDKNRKWLFSWEVDHDLCPRQYTTVTT